MSLSQSFHLPIKEIRMATIGWMVFLSCISIYCILYNQLVLLTANNFANSFGWSLREYAHWIVVTPLLLILLQRFSYKTTNHWHFINLLAGILIIALLTRASIDLYLHPNKSFAASLVYFFPSQIYTLAIITILYALFRQTSLSPEIDLTPGKKEIADTVVVMKGNGETLIKWTSVIFIRADGNYLELVTGDNTYLLRITMKQLENDLPKDQFIRIHRSYIVNIANIEKITTQNAGNGLVQLSNGQELPLSKSYKKLIKSYYSK